TTMKKVMEYGDPVGRQIEKDIAGLPKTLDVLALQIDQPAAEGIHFLLVVRDITSLTRIAKMKSEFAANASHELRTPLATIRAAVDSLESLRPEDQDEFQKIRVILNRHTTRLEELTRDLLNLHMIESARQKVQREDIQTQSLAARLREQFSPPAEEKGISLDLFVEENAKTFSTDPVLLRLIVQNLLDNAVKFTPQDGRVTCTFRRQDDHILLRVTDTGMGIAPEFQERVFERFFQAEAARSGETQTRGTGLGLAIVKHAVERLDGTVTLQSEPGKGTTIEVKLPA
ncbi:MAG: GHKL domain-containing protein, partial [Phycisphaerae bacterium]|nr:GHKL domain-containing protein [Phycisphaerae bacterium]